MLQHAATQYWKSNAHLLRKALQKVARVTLQYTLQHALQYTLQYALQHTARKPAYMGMSVRV